MIDILIRMIVIIIVSTVCLPLAFLGITHGSSFGLESGVGLIVLNIIVIIFMVTLKKARGEHDKS